MKKTILLILGPFGLILGLFLTYLFVWRFLIPLIFTLGCGTTKTLVGDGTAQRPIRPDSQLMIQTTADSLITFQLVPFDSIGGDTAWLRPVRVRVIPRGTQKMKVTVVWPDHPIIHSPDPE